jgi:hypothetical protein
VKVQNQNLKVKTKRGGRVRRVSGGRVTGFFKPQKAFIRLRQTEFTEIFWARNCLGWDTAENGVPRLLPGFGFVHKLFFILTYANLPNTFFKKSFYGLAVCFIYQIRV